MSVLDFGKKVDTIFSPQIEIFVPFAGNVDASRLNMAAKQQTQAVVSKNTDTPLIINKDYKKLTTINSPFLELAEDDGFVIYNSDNLLIIYYKNLKKLVSKYIPPLKKMVNISVSLKYKINKTTFKKGEVLYDYSNLDIETKIPRIGYRAKTLFMQWFGYSADDAVIISESFAKKAEIDYYEKVYIPITKTWKYFRLMRDDENEIETYLPLKGKINDEDLIRYNKIDLENHFIAEYTNINNDPSLFFSKNIDGFKNGEIVDIKVHFFDDINEDNYKEKINELDKKYIYNRGLIKELEPYIEEQFKEKEKLLKSFLALGLPEEQAKEMAENAFDQYTMMRKLPKHYKQFLREKFNLEDKNIDALVEIDMKITKRTTRGDKFTNLFAGKATSAMIVPDELMPKDENGKPYDVIFNTLGIPGRNNWGVIFEAALSKVIEDVEQTAKHIVENSEHKKGAIKVLKEKIDFIAENFIKNYDEEYYNEVKQLLSNYNKKTENGEYIYEVLAKDINKKGFYLFAPNFVNIPYHKFFNEFIKPYFIKFDGDDKKLRKKEITISKEFMEWLRNTWGFVGPFTDTNESKVLANDGINYMLKLHHTSFSKHNAVSFTTSYSKITGQPVRGRKKGGGQHISWQSLAALLAHKENNAVLKEFYTIKSDAIDEKENFLMKYIRDGEYYLKNKYNSVTKKTLNNALKMFSMRFEDDED